ncbi:MAG: tyrosine-type recombinase/integrase [Tepidisphaerales bacterium]
MLFKRAIKWGLFVGENPFADVVAGGEVNRSRNVFVPAEAARKVLDECPDAEWRCLFALCRWGGLRCPSEVLALRWADVNWAAGRIRVTSPKTARHPGGEERFVPLFPELRRELLAGLEAAPDGAEYVIHHRRARGGKVNWRQSLTRFIRNAGLLPWPRLFHALRASRQTELEAEYPTHVVCAWLGNSPSVAAGHYLMTTEADFARAAGGEIGGAESGARVAQNAAQTVLDADGQSATQGEENAGKNRVLTRSDAECRGVAQPPRMAPVGLEPTRFMGGGF